MRIRRILVPTDFSQTSDAALAQARELAAALGASLRLVHVFDDPFVTAALADGQMLLPQEVRAEMAAAAETRLRERLREAAGTCLGHDTALLTGPVAKTIVQYARTHAIDLIVMGTHGRSGLAHILLGSVAEHVVRAAPCPVMTVRPRPLPTAVAEDLATAVALAV